MTRSRRRRTGDGDEERGRPVRRTRFLDFLDRVLSDEHKTRRLAQLIGVTAKSTVVVALPVLLLLVAVSLVVRLDLLMTILSVALSATGIGGVASLRRRLQSGRNVSKKTDTEPGTAASGVD